MNSTTVDLYETYPVDVVYFHKEFRTYVTVSKSASLGTLWPWLCLSGFQVHSVHHPFRKVLNPWSIHIYIYYIHTHMYIIMYLLKVWTMRERVKKGKDGRQQSLLYVYLYDIWCNHTDIYTSCIYIYICKYITTIKEHTNIQNITYIYTHICILHTLHREYGHTDTSNTLDMSKAKNPGIWVFSPIWWEFDQITVKHLLIHGPMVKTRWKIIKTPGFLKLRQHCINPVTWRHGAETWQKKTTSRAERFSGLNDCVNFRFDALIIKP